MTKPKSTASVSEYRPTDIPPTTDKEWATAKFSQPTPFLGDMVFHNHTIAMLAMKTDAGKTNWTIALALALAYGKPFCDWSPQNKARVLYIEGESPKHRTQDMIRTQRLALGIQEDEVSSNFSLITRQTHGDIPWLCLPPRSGARGDNQRRDHEERRGIEWLENQIEKYKPNFIIFDSIQSLAPNMVSASATRWITCVMKPIAEYLNRKGIGQLWLHHPEKSGKAQHGTGARNWGLSLELFGVPLKDRGIAFNLMFPGKKKDDRGDNPDFDARFVQFNRDEHGISKWVVGPVTTMSTLDRDPHRPNQSAPIAMEVFRKLAKDKEDVWLQSEIGSKWHLECLKAGISTSDVRAHQNKAFIRARNHLIEERQLERRADDGWCRLFPPMPPEEELEMDLQKTMAAGSA